MRIKQKTLENLCPDRYCERTICGIHATVCVYHEPCYCVNVIAEKDGKTIKQCYPLTKEQYNIYMTGSVKEQMKLIAKGGKIYGCN